MKVKYYILFIYLALLSIQASARHIIGGEMYYECLGNNDYKITLKLYRDCAGDGAPYDDFLPIVIFNNIGVPLDTIGIKFPGANTLPSNFECFSPPNGVCVEEAIYTTTINLPPLVGGYTLSYQRCCRNNGIDNIQMPQPQSFNNGVGSTYTVHIPDPAICNSSPEYKSFPPIYVDLGSPFSFDHSAKADIDGDSLYYELCAPFDGNDALSPSDVALAPPYDTVQWNFPYNSLYPLASSPALSIDHKTGLITGTPTIPGKFVITVCVSEYRNGIFLSVNKRDFQITVTYVRSVAMIEETPTCIGKIINFNQNSANASTYHWDFGDPDIKSDSSNVKNPTWKYSNFGTYLITLIINGGTPCADTTSSTVSAFPLLLPKITTPSIEQCMKQNHFDFFSDNSIYQGNSISFLWDFGADAQPPTSTQKNPSNIVYTTPGIHQVNLQINISDNGCNKKDSNYVQINSEPVVNYDINTNTECYLTTRVQFIDHTQTGVGLNYQWGFGDGTFETSKLNPLHIYSDTGTYMTKLVVTTANNCKDSISLPVKVSLLPIPQAGFISTPQDTSIFYPEVTLVDKSKGKTACEIYWGDGTVSNDCDNTHTYTQPGTYTIMQIVTNAEGCRDSSYSEAHIRPEFLFFIPNAFTPNNDDINDVFMPKLFGVHNYTFMVFDRWGEKVFETKDVNTGWDGSIKSKRLATNELFSYKITFEDDVEQKHHQYVGTVTLVK
jgi:gliding motility-associated-like protein